MHNPDIGTEHTKSHPRRWLFCVIILLSVFLEMMLLVSVNAYITYMIEQKNHPLAFFLLKHLHISNLFRNFAI